MAISIDGTDLSTIVQNALLLESVAGGRAAIHEYAYQHGGSVQSREWYTKPKLSILRIVPNFGTPSQIYQSFHDLTGLIMGGERLLTRDDPYAGEVEAEIAVLDSVRQPELNRRYEWDFPIWILPGHFRGTADVTDSASSLGTGGSIGTYSPNGTHPTAPVITITNVSAGDNPAVAMTTGDQESIAVSGSYVASDEIIIDVLARTVTVNGTRAKTLTNISHAWWMEWAQGVSNTIAFSADSGDWDVDIAYRERWRI